MEDSSSGVQATRQRKNLEYDKSSLLAVELEEQVNLKDARIQELTASVA